MKKLWLSAIAAAFMVAGTAAHAGDHGHGHRDYDRHDRYEDRGYRHHHDGYWGRPHYREIREVYYRPTEVYYRPARYYPEPVYYERRGRSYDNDIHGTISVGF
jgi:hypothetical protein